MFNFIKRLYQEGRCTIKMLDEAVTIAWLTKEQKAEIINNNVMQLELENKM